MKKNISVILAMLMLITVFTSCDNSNNNNTQNNGSNQNSRKPTWTDIVSVEAGGSHIVGLKRNGTVVAIGVNDDGRCDVDSWTDIIAVSAKVNTTVGLKSDGTVIFCGDSLVFGIESGSLL